MKLFKKFFFTTSIIIVFTLTISVTILSFVISNYFSREKYELLSDNCESVARIAAIDFNSSNFIRNVYNVIRVQNNVTDVDTLLCDAEGKIIICGCVPNNINADCIHYSADISKEILAKTSNERYFEVGRLNGLYSEDYYTVGMQITDSDNTILGYVYSSTSAQSLRLLMREIFKMYVFSLIFPVIIMFFMVYTMTYRLTKPLKLMSEAAKNLSRGDFSKKIPVFDDDEIGELSMSFNNMSKSLAQLETMRRSFIGNVSHELRTPMTTIAGFIDGIIDGTIPEDRRDEYLEIISEEVKRLSRVVQSMLSMAKLESGEMMIKPTDFDISKTIVNIVISRENQIYRKNINVIGLDTLVSAKIRADYDLIYQVIYNLVDNAVKFTEDGGVISFELNSDINNIEFIIKNSGGGIPSENISHIFERFYKTDKSRSEDKTGVGLGLYIVKTIIDIHGGKIIAENTADKNTLFRVLLPTNFKQEDILQ